MYILSTSEATAALIAGIFLAVRSKKSEDVVCGNLLSTLN